MLTIHPYLNFNGNTEDAFNFYKKVFGGEFAMLQRFKDSPDSGKIPAAHQNKIMHIALPIGGNMLMGTDAVEGMGPKLIEGTNFSITVSPETEEETRMVFNGLSEGGTISMPLQKMFWGPLFGMCTDKFGIQWMVNQDQKPK